MHPMLLIIEVVVAGYLGCVIWRILRNPFLYNLCTAATLLIGWGAAWTAGRLAVRLLKPILANPLIMILALVALTSFAFLSTVALLRRSGPLQRLRTKRHLLIRGLGTTLNLLLVALLLAAVIGLLDFMVSLASLTALEPEIRERSLYLKRFLPAQAVPADAEAGTPLPQQNAASDTAAPTHVPLQDVMARQANFFESLREGVTGAKQSLARKLGTEEVLEQARALQALLNLSQDDSAWLVENTPELQAVTENARLQAVLCDDHILDLIIRAGEGSASAIYELSENRAIRELFSDPAIIHSIKALDLPRLQQRAANRTGDPTRGVGQRSEASGQ
jgi:hypothetical protein